MGYSINKSWQNSEDNLEINKMSTLRKKIAEALEGDRVLRNAPAYAEAASRRQGVRLPAGRQGVRN